MTDSECGLRLLFERTVRKLRRSRWFV